MTRSPLRGVVIHHLRSPRRRRRISLPKMGVLIAALAFWVGFLWRVFA